MGRGLSPLQRTFLEIAARHRQAGNDPYWTPHVYGVEVIAEHYGLLPPGGIYDHQGRRRYHRASGPGRGLDATPAMEAAASRAARRLIARELLNPDYGGRGFSLTEEGLA